MNRRSMLMWTFLIGSLLVGIARGKLEAEETKPLRALLIAGGCCHDYPNQNVIVTQGVSQRANITWEVFHGATDRDRRVAMYQTDRWADSFDVVVHNECYGGVDDPEFVNRIVRGHTETGIPAVFIHCSMHSYRNAKTDEWRQLIGVTSRRHERGGRQLDVVRRVADHPVMKAFPGSWRTPNGELYVIERTWPNCQVLATAYGVDTEQDHPVIWTNEYGKAKVFGTTLGHHNETMLSKEWLDTVSRGILWACGKLNHDGTPAEGYAGTGIAPILVGGQRPTPTGAPTPAQRQ